MVFAALASIIQLGSADVVTANGSWKYGGKSWRVSEGGGKVSVVSRKSVILEFDRSYSKALIADEKVADVLPLTDRSLYVVGKEIGATTLALLDENKNVITSLEVDVTHDLKGLRDKLRRNLPAASIAVTSTNGHILLSGSVPDSSVVRKAMAIAEQYAPKNVSHAFQVRAVQQVMLEVRFIEANRRASRELGVGNQIRNRYCNADVGGQAALIGGFVNSATLVSGAQPFGAMIANLLDNGIRADLIVRALEERGLARRLAEPNLVTMSGDKASFLAGGEFPFPVASDNDTITIEFKRFGVALEFTPTVLADGLINLKIEPEVSELDSAGGIQIGGVQIPGLVVRKAQTTVELRNGQSFAIAGLLQANNFRLSRQLPWIGKVPVLGALFRSAEYRKDQTDLVIIVTPRLVRGSVPGQRRITPLDGARPSSDADYFMLSREENPKWRTTIRSDRKHNRRRPGHIISLNSEDSR